MNFMKFALMTGLCLLSVSATTTAEDLPEQYREPFAESWPIRKEQHLQMKAYLDAFPQRHQESSDTVFQLEFSSIAAYERSLLPIRAYLRNVKGLPPPRAIKNPKPRFELVARDQSADIYRVWTEVFAGVEAYAIFMVPRGLEGKAPVIIAVHGGSGCPEAVCDLDTRVNYRSFGQAAVKRGYIFYAPGILMNVSYADPRDPRLPEADWQTLGRQATRLGTSTRDLQIYQIIEGAKAAINARPEADGNRIGMTGLSMGGGYTLATMPLWPGIKAAVCSAGFRDRRTDAKPQQLETFRFGERMPRAVMVALMCPRPLMIQSGEKDTVVPLDEVRPAIPKARAYYKKLGVEDRFEFNVHPGGHVFENDAIFGFFDKHLR
jgi:dienelactone hydrolase